MYVAEEKRWLGAALGCWLSWGRVRPTVLHMCVQGVGLEAVHGLGSRRSAWKVTADVLKVTVAVFAGRCNCVFGIREFCGCCFALGWRQVCVGTYGVRGL